MKPGGVALLLAIVLLACAPAQTTTDQKGKRTPSAASPTRRS